MGLNYNMMGWLYTIYKLVKVFGIQLFLIWILTFILIVLDLKPKNTKEEKNIYLPQYKTSDVIVFHPKNESQEQHASVMHFHAETNQKDNILLQKNIADIPEKYKTKVTNIVAKNKHKINTKSNFSINGYQDLGQYNQSNSNHSVIMAINGNAASKGQVSKDKKWKEISDSQKDLRLKNNSTDPLSHRIKEGGSVIMYGGRQLNPELTNHKRKYKSFPENLKYDQLLYKLQKLKDDLNAHAMASNFNEYSNYTLIKELPTTALNLSYSISDQAIKPIVTLITTFKCSNDSITRAMNQMVLKYWSTKLKPWAELVLFIDAKDNREFKTSGLEACAVVFGWKVLEASKAISNYPVLKEMYLDVLKVTSIDIPFVAFANSDIMFDYDLIETLLFIKEIYMEEINKDGCLFIGKRTPVSFENMTVEVLFQNISMITQKLLSFKSKIKTNDAFDYFITTRNGIKWDETPDFVVGKPGYDSWIVVMALQWGLVTVDLTQTVMAYHIVPGNNLFPEQGWMGKDVCMNRDMVDPFDYSSGRNYCAKYFTNFRYSNITNSNKKVSIELLKRQSLQDQCHATRLDNKLSYPKCRTTAYLIRKKIARYKTFENYLSKLKLNT